MSGDAITLLGTTAYLAVLAVAFANVVPGYVRRRDVQGALIGVGLGLTSAFLAGSLLRMALNG